jgi:hypothetical protein
MWWAAIAVVWLGLILWVGRHTGYFFDDWDFVLGRRTGGLSDFTNPHADHVVILPVAIYKASWAIFGDGAVWPLRTLCALFYLGCATLIFDLLRARCDARLALIGGVLFLFAGKGAVGILLAFQFQFAAAVFLGLLAFWALDHDTPWALPVAACSLLVCAVTSGLCVFFFAAVAAELLVSRRRRDLLILVPAILVFGAWYLAKGQSSMVQDGVWKAPGWAIEAATYAAGALVSAPDSWGSALLVLLIGALIAGLWWRPASPRLIAMLVLGGGFWLATGAARSAGPVHEAPDAGRYVLLGLAVYLLVIGELLRGIEVPDRVIAAGGMVGLSAVALGFPLIRASGKNLRDDALNVNGGLLALRLAGPIVPPYYPPEPVLAPQVLAGDFFANGTDIVSGRLGNKPASTRNEADKVLSQIAVKRTSRAVTGGVCKPISKLTTVIVRPGGRLGLRGADTPVYVAVSRFGSTLQPLPSLKGSAGLRFARDADPTPYTVNLSGRPGADVCV